MGETKIEWTDATWNPGIFGCEEVSPACANCYAAPMAHRLVGMGRYPEGVTARRASGVHWSGVVRVADSIQGLDGLPKRAHKRVFVTSMSDLFHKDVPFRFIADVFDAMNDRQHLTFQVLTKRPERAFEWWQWSTALPDPDQDKGIRYCWPRNVWLGATVEDQARADERIPWLLRVPAPVRLLSMEPLLGPVNLRRVVYDGVCAIDALEGLCGWPSPHADCERLHWVITGGESGHRARPSNPQWFRNIRDACLQTDVPFFFKQWGSWVGEEDCDAAPRGYHEQSSEDGGRPRHEWPSGSGCPGHPVAYRETSYHFGRDYDPKTLDGVTHRAFPVTP